MPMPRWMIHRLRESMGSADFLDLDHIVAVDLELRDRDSPTRGPYRLTRDALNAIPPEPDPRPPTRSHGYVLKNGIYQA